MKAKPDISQFSRHVLGLDLSDAQDTILRAYYRVPPASSTQADLFEEIGGGRPWPAKDGPPISELTVPAGARGGKSSHIATPISIYEAIYGDWPSYVRRGEQPMFVVVAQDTRAASIVFSYIQAHFDHGILKSQMNEATATEIRLKNRAVIGTFSSTIRSLRGWSIPCGAMDELAFWRAVGAADSDEEVQASSRRGGLSFPVQRLVKVSTPYLKSGVLHADHQQSFGVDDPDRLVVVASSALMNPTITDKRLARERRRDPSRYEREYMAVWIDSLTAFLSSEWIEPAIERDIHERPPVDGISYVAAIDASGGSSDAFTLAICHEDESGIIVQDVMRSWRGSRKERRDLEGVVAEVADIVKRYGCPKILGDRYSAGWIEQAIERHGFRYMSDRFKDKSEAYLGLEPALAQGRVALLDHQQMLHELRILERHAMPGGRTRVDHPKGQHDDHSNALALAVADIALKPEAVGLGDIAEAMKRHNDALRTGTFTERMAAGGSLYDEDGNRIVNGIAQVGAYVSHGPREPSRRSCWRIG